MISQVESFLCPDKHGTPEEAGGYSGWNVVEITIKMKSILDITLNNKMVRLQ